MRINFFAGACAGKTTTASWLFSELKRRDVSVEFAQEYIKEFTYGSLKPDQEDVFENQTYKELLPLYGGVKNIVTESPIHLSFIYSTLYGDLKTARKIQPFIKAIDEMFPSVSIYLDRGNKPFKPEGRWGTLEDAKVADAAIIKYLKGKEKRGHQVLYANWTQLELILHFAAHHCDQ